MLKRAEELGVVSLGRPARSPERVLAGQKQLQAIRDEYDNRHYTTAKNLGKSYLGAFKDLGSFLATPTRPLPGSRAAVLEASKGSPDYAVKAVGGLLRRAKKMDQDAGQWIIDKNQQAGDYIINGVTNAGKSFAAHPVQSTKEFLNEGFVEPTKGLGQHIPAYIAAGKERGWMSDEANDELMNAGFNGVHLGTNLMLGLGTIGKRMGLNRLAVAGRNKLLPGFGLRAAAKLEAAKVLASSKAIAKLPAPRYLNSPAKGADGPLTREGIGTLSGADKAWQAELAVPTSFNPTSFNPTIFNPNASWLQKAVPVSPGFAKGTAQTIAGAELLAWNGLFPSMTKRDAPSLQDQSIIGPLTDGPVEAPFFQAAQAQQDAIDNADLNRALTGVPDFQPISTAASTPAPELSSPDSNPINTAPLQPTTLPPGRSLLPYAGWVAGGLAAGGLLAWTINHARQKKLEAKKRQYPLAQRYPALYGSR